MLRESTCTNRVTFENTNSNNSDDVFALSKIKCDSEFEIMSDFETNSSNSDDVFDLSENNCDSEMESIMSDT